ncbi:MAG: biotin/lipoyl-binding protein, partial [Smithella sp.]
MTENEKSEEERPQKKDRGIRNKIIFILAFAGLLAGLIGAYVFGIEKKPPPPAFNPASNPYENGIYAQGIIESFQSNGANINIYPEVSGTVKQIFISEGEVVKKGTPLLLIEDSVQRATVEQQKSQVELAGANLKTSQDQLEKQRRSYELDPRSLSKNDLDNAVNAVKVARANVDVARKQYLLSQALLYKYIIRSAAESIILSINISVGSYISPQGSYDTYTQGFTPVLVLGGAKDSLEYLGVRCYIDEILVPRLPPMEQAHAQIFVRGTNISIPLEFVRIQPYISPKIELSN